MVLEMMRTLVQRGWMVACAWCGIATVCVADAPDYSQHIAPLFKKYCSGCHNADDAEGKFVLETHAALLAGGKHGAAIVPGKSGESRMMRMLRGDLEPVMPPDEHERPTPDEIKLLAAWIDGGAKGPGGAAPDPHLLVVPKVPRAVEKPAAIASLALSPDGKLLALARGRQVELLDAATRTRRQLWSDHAGPVHAVTFSRDGQTIVAATGETGLFGEARLWNVADGKLIRRLQGHRDTLYAARLSPDGKLLATGSYDQKVQLWDVATGKSLRTIAGHNGAVLDLDFSPDGQLLATASADRTVKLWRVATGERLDTFGQPLRDQYAVAFSPDGRSLAAGGADRRIRIWSISPSAREGTNLLVHTRFAHDGGIIRLAWSPDGRTLVSSADNRTLSVWDADDLRQRESLPTQADWAAGLALGPDGRTLFIGRLDGSWDKATIAAPRPIEEAAAPTVAKAAPSATAPASGAKEPVAEVEPNNTPQQAQTLSAPATVRGKFLANGGSADDDLYRFEARAGQTWIVETNAARSGSSADTKVELLHADGRPVVRTRLQAVRDSAVTFRGADGNAGGFRLTNWEEMELNEYLFVGGEVLKLFRFPQGPDSDFFFYTSEGRRRGYFDTTPTTHYLDEPCYIVRPHPPGAKFEPNGLPVFPVHYANDDDSLRKLGSDSRLTFVAPADGAYLVRVRDVRGLAGEKFTYDLTIRPARPDFTVSVAEKNPSLPAGSGQRFTLRLDRLDGFDGDVRVDITNVPPGLVASSPLVIQAGHDSAQGMLFAPAGVATPSAEAAKQITLTATATIDGQRVEKPAANFGPITIAKPPKVIVHLELDAPANPHAAPEPAAIAANFRPAELTLAPGGTVTARLRIERHGYDGDVKFDVDNLPHGVIVDNIGLSGILIPAGKSERQIFLSARPWVPETSRLFHAVTQVEGNQASLPMLLHVRRGGAVARAGERGMGNEK